MPEITRPSAKNVRVGFNYFKILGGRVYCIIMRIGKIFIYNFFDVYYKNVLLIFRHLNRKGRTQPLVIPTRVNGVNGAERSPHKTPRPTCHLDRGSEATERRDPPITSINKRKMRSFDCVRYAHYA